LFFVEPVAQTRRALDPRQIALSAFEQRVAGLEIVLCHLSGGKPPIKRNRPVWPPSIAKLCWAGKHWCKQHPASRLPELLSWNCKLRQIPAAAA
jgi:hypothetical protein